MKLVLSFSTIRMKSNLQYCAEMIPTLSTQLSIIASVKAATPNDTSVSHCATNACILFAGSLHKLL